LPVSGVFSIPIPGDGSFRFVFDDADFHARQLYWRGLRGYEWETFRVFLRLVTTATRFIDVGAHLGTYTLVAAAANPQIRVTALEPLNRVFAQMARSVEANGWEDRCELLCVAAAEADGESELIDPGFPFAVSARLTGSPHPSRDPTTPIVVPTAKIDSIVKDDDVDLLKIDVEGAEDRVLEGALRTLERSRPSVIIECLPQGPITSVQAVLDRFAYAHFHLTKDGPRRVERIRPDPTGCARNFLSVGTPNALRLLDEMRGWPV
jgi:FkbM family methyltransferase